MAKLPRLEPNAKKHIEANGGRRGLPGAGAALDVHRRLDSDGKPQPAMGVALVTLYRGLGSRFWDSRF